jgi:hypothetical protein
MEKCRIESEEEDSVMTGQSLGMSVEGSQRAHRCWNALLSAQSVSGEAVSGFFVVNSSLPHVDCQSRYFVPLVGRQHQNLLFKDLSDIVYSVLGKGACRQDVLDNSWFKIFILLFKLLS